MAPNRGSSKPVRGGRSSSTGTRKPSGVSKNRVAQKTKLPPPKQQKTKSASSKTKNGVGMKKKKRVYTDKELGIPKLNMITPLGVEAPKGKKRGKVFIDDAESMMTILAIVNADKEGQIESKMQKSRHLEEIRAARKLEAEKREQARKGKFEETKDSIRKPRKLRSGDLTEGSSKSNGEGDMQTARPKKRVSFG